MAMVFKFLKMDDAKRFVADIQTRFAFGGQIFENERAAFKYEPRPTPVEQLSPIVELDRADFSIECEIVELAERKFGGSYLGT